MKVFGDQLPKGEFKFKIILIGAYKVGKTSLIKRFVDDTFQESYIATLGAEILNKTLELTKETIMNYIIWDIGGQKTFASFRSRFFSGAEGALIVIDRTRLNHLESINFWYDEVKKHVLKDIPIAIVGNKSDLIDEIVISEEQIKEIADQYGFFYILASAKTGDKVNDIFLYIAYKALEKKLIR